MAQTIMSVDDSASLRQMVTMTLETAGYDMLEACDGVDALAKLTGKTVDLVITDLNMPNMDGIELIKNLRTRADFKFVPILFLTTESSPAKKLEAKAAGATGWIAKPFSPDQLVAAVKKVTR